ncbi:hypothetical protein HMPREF9374_0851 [Desmospora sp. 8437]|nr:hypothetical protein HMPREF9374_0851 [Desmospora sp. 8437]
MLHPARSDAGFSRRSHSTLVWKRCDLLRLKAVGMGFHMTFRLFLRAKVTPCEIKKQWETRAG